MLATSETLAQSARSLSSGTMSKLCRDYGILYDYQSSQTRWLDAVQLRFAIFCETNHVKDCDTWVDAFSVWAKRFHFIHRQCWTCGYQGTTDYIIDGKRYEANWSKNRNAGWNGGFEYFDKWLVPKVGTISCYITGKGFPPDDVSCFFLELVPMRSQASCADDWKWIYDERFGNPQVQWGTRGWDKDYLECQLNDNDQWDKVDYDTDSHCQYVRKHFRR